MDKQKAMSSGTLTFVIETMEQKKLKNDVCKMDEWIDGWMNYLMEVRVNDTSRRLNRKQYRLEHSPCY